MVLRVFDFDAKRGRDPPTTSVDFQSYWARFGGSLSLSAGNGVVTGESNFYEHSAKFELGRGRWQQQKCSTAATN